MSIIPYGRAGERARRRIIAILVCLGITAGLVASALLAGPVMRAVRMLSAQNRCMGYSGPEPLTFAEPLRSPESENLRFRDPARSGYQSDPGSASRSSPLFQRWQEFSSRAHAPSGNGRCGEDGADGEDTTLIFLHALRAKDDSKVYIVCVRYRLDVQNWVARPVLTPSGVQLRFSLSSEFTTNVVAPGGLVHPPQFLASATSPAQLMSDLSCGGVLRFQSAAVDPTDPAAFEIRYRFNGAVGVIHGVLRNASLVELRCEMPSSVEAQQ